LNLPFTPFVTKLNEAVFANRSPPESACLVNTFQGGTSKFFGDGKKIAKDQFSGRARLGHVQHNLNFWMPIDAQSCTAQLGIP